MPAFASHFAPWVAALALCVLGDAVAQSATWPTRAVRIVVPFAAGGYTDTYARVIAQDLGRVLPQPVVVDNRPGNGGNLGSDLVAKAAPDGYTLIVGAFNTHAVHATLYSSLPFDPLRDFTPIAFVAEATSVLVVAPHVPATTLRELLDLARTRPGGMDYGSSGVGTLGNLHIESMKSQTGIPFQQIAYRGEGEVLLALLRGDIAFASMSVSTALPQIRAGKIRPIATSGRTRSQVLPEVGTIGETLPGLGGNSWVALFGPAGVPDEIVQKLNREVDRIMRSPEVRQRMAANDIAYVSMTPAQLGEFQRAEARRWGDVVRANKLRVD